MGEAPGFLALVSKLKVLMFQGEAYPDSFRPASQMPNHHLILIQRQLRIFWLCLTKDADEHVQQRDPRDHHEECEEPEQQRALLTPGLKMGAPQDGVVFSRMGVARKGENWGGNVWFNGVCL